LSGPHAPRPDVAGRALSAVRRGGNRTDRVLDPLAVLAVDAGRGRAAPHLPDERLTPARRRTLDGSDSRTPNSEMGGTALGQRRAKLLSHDIVAAPPGSTQENQTRQWDHKQERATPAQERRDRLVRRREGSDADRQSEGHAEESVDHEK